MRAIGLALLLAASAALTDSEAPVAIVVGPFDVLSGYGRSDSFLHPEPDPDPDPEPVRSDVTGLSPSYWVSH